MKRTGYCILLTLALCSVSVAQLRDYRTHVRSSLRETVFNTGELGRAFDRGTGGIPQGFSSMEWPPNSRMVFNSEVYYGQHNSFGGGIWIAGKPQGGVQLYDYCGAVTQNNGDATRVEGEYSDPLFIDRIENYPVLSDGNLNPAYNPNEAEEIIISKWKTHTLKTTVTRTSRAWSFPGYDNFIIFEYEIENNDTVTISDMFISFTYGFGPSAFGYQRMYNRWGEGDYRTSHQFARYDLKRWMSYNHDREGKPESDSVQFASWSKPGNRGGLNSPQAAGILPLYYDYDHLAVKGQTSIIVSRADSMVVWDQNNKIKQPYLNRYENANVYPTKIQAWLNPNEARKTGPFQGRTDSTYFLALQGPDGMPGYWMGRGKPSWTLSWAQPVAHAYGFGPYTLPPGEKLRFTIAEVVGYGPGVAGDSIYQDLGGGVRGEPAPGLHPVPSWYKTMTYDNLGTPPVIGSNYLQTHPLPFYVSPEAISIRDVADRAIQMYTGRELIKYDSLQFEPRTTGATGAYNTTSIPVPAPVFKVENTVAAVNKLTWGPQVESFSSPRLHAPFKHYEVYHALDMLGPWTLVDSVSKGDPRYFDGTNYVVMDTSSNIGDFYMYAIISVDSLGGKSGMTNITVHETQAPAATSLNKVYVVPNPLIVTSGRSGRLGNNEAMNAIQFSGLTKDCTIRIYSYSGQLINTIEHHADAFSEQWYQLSSNNQVVASGVYFFVAQDESGVLAKGKFVVIQ